TLLALLLRGKRPDTFRERHEQTGRDGAPLDVNAQAIIAQGAGGGEGVHQAVGGRTARRGRLVTHSEAWDLSEAVTPPQAADSAHAPATDDPARRVLRRDRLGGLV